MTAHNLHCREQRQRYAASKRMSKYHMRPAVESMAVRRPTVFQKRLFWIGVAVLILAVILVLGALSVQGLYALYNIH